MPPIESNYRADPARRTLMGSSYGRNYRGLTIATVVVKDEGHSSNGRVIGGR